MLYIIGEGLDQTNTNNITNYYNTPKYVVDVLGKPASKTHRRFPEGRNHRHELVSSRRMSCCFSLALRFFWFCFVFVSFLLSKPRRFLQSFLGMHFQHARFIPIVGVGKRGAYELIHGDLPRKLPFGTKLRLTDPVPADSRR